MKPKGADIARFCARPPAQARGALIYGEDQALAAERRDALLAALLGPHAEAEMRLTRIEAATLRADPAAVDDALRATGFFPGPRAVVVAGATDAAAPALAAALGAATPQSFLLATADALGARSALRTLFEGAPDAAALACYPDRPTAQDLADRLRAAGADPTPDACAAFEAAARDMGRGEIARLAETLALHSPAAAGQLTAADVEALAPQAGEGAVEAALDALLDGGAAAVRRELARLAAQGTKPVELAIAAQRRLRQLHAVAVGGPGASAALARIMPPSRRDRAAAQARRWGQARLERALAALHEADAGLRGGSPAPAWPLLERALLRVAN